MKWPWPPRDEVLTNIFKDLPAGASSAHFELAVIIAIDIYLRADGNPDRVKEWGRILKLTQSKVVKRLIEEIKNLKAPWGSVVAKFLADLDDLIETANFYAQFAKSRSLSPREQLYSNLLIAWTGPGRGQLSDSEDGPLARVMCAILTQVLPEPLEPRSIRDIIRREKQRRTQQRPRH